MGAILAENELHHAYWRSVSKPTITTVSGGEKEGFEFVNMFDNNAHTSFKNNSSTQSVIKVDLGTTKSFNGFAIYGHNLTTSQAIKLEYSLNDSSYSTFTDSAVYPANGQISPSNNNGEAFCVYLKGTPKVGRYWKITTVGWDPDTFITTLALGSFVDHINISAPYTMPSFTPQMVATKRNNLGNLLSSDVTKIPQKLNINLNTLQESDLDATQSGITNTTINGRSATYSFVDYLGYYLSRFPFFVLHDDGGDGTNTEKRIDRDKIYFCTIDKSLRQPKWNNPTTLSWNIRAIGYIS